MAEPFGYDADTFIEGYQLSISEKWSDAVESDRFERFIKDELLENNDGKWIGTSSDLLKEYSEDMLDNNNRPLKGLPQHASTVGRAIKQLIPPFRKLGIQCTEQRIHGKKEWVIELKGGLFDESGGEMFNEC